MDSSVRLRPTHYETLGLTPAATDEEIVRAFAREIGRPRVFGGLALLGLAYETLRHPAKREAYDTSLGLRPASPPQPADGVAAWRDGSSFFAFASPRLASAAESFTAAPAPDPTPPPRAAAEPLRHPLAQPMPKPDLMQELRLSSAEHRRLDWTKPAIAAGGLVAAVVALGAFAGWNAGSGEAARPAEAAVRIALPPATPRAVALDPAPASPREASKADQSQVAHAATARVQHAPATARPSLPADFLAQAVPVESAPAEESSTTTAAAEAPPVETAAALPLPEPVIARTIDRIGFSCGKVASSSAVGVGVYKVTCTSGASYQATPVRGRYHFRRLSGK